MFLLPAIALGIALALLLGGRPSRFLALPLRHGWAVVLALGLQAALFSAVGGLVPAGAVEPVHLASYALLLVFAVANARTLALLPFSLGMASNAVAIAANGGRMPVSKSAWEAAGLSASDNSNVAAGGERLTFLGDVFAVPRELPLGNVFSVGDLLIAVGVVVLIVAASIEEPSERVLEPARLVRPLASAPFRRLVSGNLVSSLGDWLTLAALVGWVYGETSSIGQVAVLMLVRLGPPILGGGIAAGIVDRLPKERLVVGLELARGAVVAGALVAVSLGSRPGAFVALAASGALAAISAATIPALVPSLLPRDELPAANAALGIAQDGAMALGALGAGIVLTASDVTVALAIDLATFAAAAYLFSRIPAFSPPPARLSAGGLVAGLRYLLATRTLLVVVAAFAAATLATGLANATLPRFLGDELGLGLGAYGFGLAALAGGLVVGEAVVGLARIGGSSGRWIGVTLFVMSGLFAALALTDHAPTAILFLAFIGFLDGTTDVLFDTIVQRDTDPRYLGRVFGFASASYRTTMMAAVAVAPLANGLALPHHVILFAGLFLLGASVIALVGTRPGASARPVPARIGSR
ncbi:MAG: MFS transporter [Actinomycetota bacterium]|nr:MFS transporter [Actinomycetota bacterium]